MSIPLGPTATHVTLARLVGSAPDSPGIDPNHPWLDNRGPATYRSVVGCVPGDRFELQIARTLLPESVAITVRSSNPSLVEVVTPTGPTTETTVSLRIHEQSGRDHVDATVSLIAGGHTLHGVLVRVYQPLRVRAKCYLATRDGSIPAHLNDEFIPSLERQLNDIWRRAGVLFTLDRTLIRHTMELASGHPELRTSDMTTLVTARAARAGFLHFVFARQITASDFLGYCFLRVPKRPVGVKVSPNASAELVTTVAHEVGHGWGLLHPFEDNSPVPHPPISNHFLMHKDNHSGLLIPLYETHRCGHPEGGAERVRRAIRSQGQAT